MKLREALELLKDFDQDHEVHFVTPADASEGPPRLMLVSAWREDWLCVRSIWEDWRLARATTAHVPPSNVPPGHTTQGGIGKPGV